MKSSFKTSLMALAVAGTLALTGCANTGGAAVTGSHASDYGIAGGLLGAVAGHFACQGLHGSKGQCNNVALAAGAAGAYAGYQQGKSMDQAEAQQRQMQAQRMQSLIQQNAGLQAQVQYAQMQVQTPQGVQNQPVAQALQMPVAHVEMINPKNGGLSKKAVKNLQYMSGLAQRENAELLVFVPSTDAVYMGAIRGTVPGAQVMLQNEQPQYFIVVKPRFAQQQQQPQQQYGQPGGYNQGYNQGGVFR